MNFPARMISFVAAVMVLALSGRAWAQGDPCGTWVVTETPDLNTDHAIIRDVAVIAPDDAWAVGGFIRYSATGTSETYAFSMHWDGVSWSSIPTPSPTACADCTSVTLWAVDATGPNDVWAAGDQRIQGSGPYGYLGTHILVMHWDGVEWTVMDTPNQSDASGEMVWGVEATAPDDVWFFGEGFYAVPNQALAMHWDGSRFEVTRVPGVNPRTIGFGDGNALRDGSALASNDIWAVGAASDGDSMPSPLSQIQHWNGSEWTHVPAASMPGVWNDLNAVVAIAPDDVWAAGEYFDTAYHGLALHWDGNAWTQVPIPGGVSDMFAFAGNDVYAVGAAVMHWDGVSWTIVESFTQVDYPSMAGIDAAGPCELWLGGRQFVSDTLQPFAARLASNPAPGNDDDGIRGGKLNPGKDSRPRASLTNPMEPR